MALRDLALYRKIGDPQSRSCIPMKGVPNEKFGLDGERSGWLDGTVTKVVPRAEILASFIV